jgi:hypothetical protein
MVTHTDTRLASSSLAAARAGIKVLRLVVSVYEQAEGPAEKEYEIEVCEVPVRGRPFAWRRLDSVTHTSYSEVQRALAYYQANLAPMVLMAEARYERAA